MRQRWIAALASEDRFLCCLFERGPAACVIAAPAKMTMTSVSKMNLHCFMDPPCPHWRRPVARGQLQETCDGATYLKSGLDLESNSDADMEIAASV
jgi:hypothetical protein